jgi:hypothetical protein
MTGDFIQRRDRAYRGASRMLTGHGRHTQAEWLRELASWVEVNSGGVDPVPDRYGAGPQVADLEQEAAALLGKPAAVLMPSGIMAQQAALRAWAERSGRNTVGLHLKSHFLVHELDALRELHGLRPVVVTEQPRPTLASDLTGIPEPLGSLTVELPLRDCAYVLPTWEQLTELAAAAAERAIRFHIDGARVWESAPFLGHGYAQIAAVPAADAGLRRLRPPGRRGYPGFRRRRHRAVTGAHEQLPDLPGRSRRSAQRCDRGARRGCR